MNPIETMRRQVEELIIKGFMKEITRTCTVLVLFTPKKDEIWRKCEDNCAIDKIPVKYYFRIPRLDDMLEMMSGATIYSKIDSKSNYHQIRIYLDDEWKTTFETKDGLYE